MKLREWREGQGLTIDQLAARLGVAGVTVSRYETGARVPEPTAMQAIYRVTDGAVAPNDFYALSLMGEAP